MPKQYLTAEDIQEVMGVKQAKAYNIIKDLNKDLEAEGIYTVSGRVLKSYFEERTGYVFEDTKKDTPTVESKVS